MRPMGKLFGVLLLGAVVTGMTVWVMGALDYAPLPLDDVREINQLVEQPAFYNTLTTNCTTNILFHARASGGIARYNWKILLSGYAPDYVYEVGGLDTSLSFVDLKQRSNINARARMANDVPDFSQRIRTGLPC